MKLLKNKIVAFSLVSAMVLSLVPQVEIKTNAATGSVPTNLTFEKTSASSMVLRWNKVTGATEYKIYEADSRFGTFNKLIGTSTETSFDDLNYDSGYYKVAAVV
nr:fibronectin type III domain-containing protein [Eubacterium sp.]